MLLPFSVRLQRAVTFQLSLSRFYSRLKMPSALVILSEGSEEMETVITVDVLRRGEIDVTVAGLGGTEPVTCSRGVVIKPDKSLDEALTQEYDAVVCPGGLGGAKNMVASSKVGELLRKQEKRGAYVACVCAAPLALKAHNIAAGKTLTSHPSIAEEMKQAGYTYSEDRVVQDGKLLTSRGPGTCFEFALAIVEQLQGKAKRDSLIPPMLLKL